MYVVHHDGEIYHIDDEENNLRCLVYNGIDDLIYDISVVYSYHNINIWTVRTSILIDNRTHREENWFIDGIKYAVIKMLEIILLKNNEYAWINCAPSIGWAR